MANTAAMAGDRFGSLMALRMTPERTKHGEVVWEFLCDCGNHYDYSYQAAKAACKKSHDSNVPSCGCYRKSSASVRATNYFRNKRI